MVLLAFLTLLTSQSSFGRPANYPPVQFLNTEVCNQKTDANPACTLFSGDFADWDQASQAKVQTAIDLMPSGKLERVIDVLRKGGLKKIVYVKKTDGKTMAGTSVEGDTAYIEVDRDFFTTPLSYGNVSEQTHALIHELMHVYIHYYVGNDFFAAPFWDDLKTGLEWNYQKGLNGLVDAKAYGNHWVTRNRLKDQGQLNEAIAADLGYARSLGFPSLYSMSQMEEYFCELASFLVHDPSVQNVPPPPVINWFLKNELAFLLDSQTPLPEPKVFADRHVDSDGKFDYVGMLFFNDMPVCTVTILQHGFLVLARHCLDPSWFANAKTDTKFTYLNVQFRPAKGQIIRIDGFNFTQVQGDTGNDDLAYIRYPAEATAGIQLPVFDVIKDQSAPLPAEVFTVGYPLPTKVQHLERMVSQPCRLSGKTGELPGYQGQLVGTTCPAWFGSSGSLFFAASPQPGHIQVLGALSHTFSADANGQPLPSAVSADAWGPYTDSNFSPMWLAGWPAVHLASAAH